MIVLSKQKIDEIMSKMKSDRRKKEERRKLKKHIKTEDPILSNQDSPLERRSELDRRQGEWEWLWKFCHSVEQKDLQQQLRPKINVQDLKKIVHITTEWAYHTLHQFPELSCEELLIKLENEGTTLIEEKINDEFS